MTPSTARADVVRSSLPGAGLLTPATLRKIVAEAYAANYLLVSLGFLQSQLVLAFGSVMNDGGQLHAVLQLRYPGKNPFTILVSGVITEAQSEQIRDAWQWFVEKEKPQMTEEELERFIAPTFVVREKVSLLLKLSLSGFLEHFDGSVTSRAIASKESLS